MFPEHLLQLFILYRPTLQSIEAIKDPALLVKVYEKLVLKNALI